MSVITTHSIGKISFHLKGVKTKNVFAQRQAVETYLQGNFANMLDDVFNSLVPDGDVLFIPQLKIHLKEPVLELNESQLNNLIKQEIKNQLQGHLQQYNSLKQLPQSPSSSQSTKSSTNNSFAFWKQVWTFYLQNGFLPAYVHVSLWKERLHYFGQFRTHQPQLVKEYFIQSLKEDTQLQRFLLNEDNAVKLFVLETIHTDFEMLYTHLFKIKWDQTANQYLQHNLSFLLNTELSKMIMESLPVQEIIHAGEKMMMHQLLVRKTPTEEKLEAEKHVVQSLFVSNAGIVLLQPFIPQLFKALQITDPEGKKINHQAKACALLCKLAGDETTNEPTYALYKILCGLQVGDLVNTAIELTKEENNECSILLEQVIAHWTAVKQISTSSLQQTFLQRNGKLSFRNEQWNLQVEAKTEDVLLQYVPWSYSIIRYPWMPQPLFTEWIL